ncbi:arsenate reductase (glutaredoxin) [Trinickia sp. LjRoot230]|uniref:arsenate reductase (glutaredoxin) n=1 Tax=Trinickia sp. LjRoot230 TaxID=3342288 RepID=UPI003ECC75A4
MVTIYHNTRCSKSRAACELVRGAVAASAEPVRVIEYLKEPLDKEQLKDLHRMLGGAVRDMIRDSEPLYEQLGLDDIALSDAALFEALAAHPLLLQRPIVIRNGRAVIGRPPEAVRTLFD